MSHCRTCKHWEPPAGTVVSGRRVYGVCEVASSRDGEPEYEETLAYAADADVRRYAELRTADNFGCVQFAPHDA